MTATDFTDIVVEMTAMQQYLYFSINEGNGHL